MTKFLFSLILMTGISSGQMQISGDTWTAASNGSFIIQNGSGLVRWSNLSQAETRKNDNKGPTILQVRSAAKLLDKATLAPISYTNLARSIGVTIPAEEADILQVIYDQELKVYDYDKVDNYLYRKALTQGTQVRWVWKPIRDKDIKALQSTSGRTNVGIIYNAVYTNKIPMRILQEAKEILDKIPDAILLVSDYEVIRPDPFLAITTEKLLNAGKLWIIDQWDEPAFDDSSDKIVAVVSKVK